jgi:hypothetical protein
MTKSIGNGVVARRGSARITYQQFAEWAPRIPQDVRHFITTDPKKLDAAGMASVMLLVYEHEKILSPANRAHVYNSLRNAEKARRGLRSFFGNEAVKVGFGIYRILNPLTLLLMPFRKFVQKQITPLGAKAAEVVTDMPTDAVLWKRLIGQAWAPINAKAAMLATTLALGAVIDVLDIDLGDLFGDMLGDLGDSLGSGLNFAVDALATSSPYAWSAW